MTASGRKAPVNLLLLLAFRIEVESTTECDFSRKFHRGTGFPLILDNHAVSSTLLSVWEPSALVRAHGDQRVQASDPAFIVASSGETMDLVELSTWFLEHSRDRSVIFDEEWIRRNHSLFERALRVPPELVKLLGDKGQMGMPARSILSISGHTHGLGFHSHPPAWLTLLHGQKQWLVYPPVECLRGLPRI